MKKSLDTDTLRKMSENALKLKKNKSSYTTLLYMGAVMLFLQGIMFVLGGLNFWMLIGIIMSIVVFFTGTKKYDSPFILYVLLAVNVLAAVLFLIVHPVSEMLLRLGVMQHFYLALECWLYIRTGKEKYDLSLEYGYPYFTELAEYEKQEKEYVPEYIPENPVTDGNASMNNLQENEISPDLRRKILLEKNPQCEGMEELNPDEIIKDSFFHGDIRKEMYNTFSEQYKASPEPAPKPVEYDKEELERNRKRMKRYKFIQKSIFMADYVFVLITLSNFLGNGMDVLNNPLVVLYFFPIAGAVLASLITVTCLDNRDIIKYAMYGFVIYGVVFTLLTFEPSFFVFFLIYAGQMMASFRLADEEEYLKNQLGYPYFTQNQIRRQYEKKEYVPEHRINFTNSGMDEIK